MHLHENKHSLLSVELAPFFLTIFSSFMGNKYKSKLSDMISSGSWIYNKLSLKHPKQNKSPSPQIRTEPTTVTDMADSNPRKSYHFSRELNPEQANSPRKTVQSKKVLVDSKFRGRVGSYSPSSSTSNTTICSTPPSRRARRPSPEFRFDRVLSPDLVDKTNSCSSSSSSSSSSASRSLSDPDLVEGDVIIATVNLTPIMTKMKNKMVGDAATEEKLCTSKRFPSLSSTTTNSPGVRLRTHSPRLLMASRRIQARKGAAVRPRRSNHETNGKCRGFAVVKLSFDPWKDFRESMVEMIVENGIKRSEDLKELLACYLSLNTEEYHEVIVAVFKQIWCDLTDTRFA